VTPAMRFFKRIAEKWFGTWNEGPEPPDRLMNMVFVFALEHPHATRGDWIRFSIEHAAEAYRSAYTRGVEYAERTPVEPGTPPDKIADAVDPNWRWGDEVDLTNLNESGMVRDEVPPEYVLMREHVEHMRQREAERRRRNG
jgi:hypothetical protein